MFVSIIISVFNEQGNIDKLLTDIRASLSKTHKYEIIFVNDGSSDNSEQKILNYCNKYKSIKLISFTKNYGHEIAMTAGMDLATGDAVIFMDADLQHPPEKLNEMIEKWEAGARIVLTRRISNSAHTFLYKILSKIYYKTINYLSEFNMQTNSPDFRLIDRYYIDILKDYRESSRLFRGILYMIDAKSETALIEFEAPERFAGESKYDFIKLTNLAIDSILAFSIKPLRIALLTSLSVFLFSLFFGFWTLVAWAIGFITVPGLTTLIMLTIILGSANLLVLSVIGEYIGRIHIEVKKRPLYTIQSMVNFYEM